VFLMPKWIRYVAKSINVIVFLHATRSSGDGSQSNRAYGVTCALLRAIKLSNYYFHQISIIIISQMLMLLLLRDI
jgi:hypothetical protein